MTDRDIYGFDAATLQNGAIRRNWGWIVALGAVFIIAGLAAMGHLFMATLVTVFYVGIAMLITGAMEIVTAFRIQPVGRSLLWGAIGALTVFAGFLVFYNPVMAAVSLTAVLGVALIVAGVFKLIVAWHIREFSPWPFVALSGAISVLLGALIFAQWPVSGLYILGLFLAVNLLFEGVGWVVLGLAAKPEGETVSREPR